MGTNGPAAGVYGIVIPTTAVKTSGRSRAASYASWVPQSWLGSGYVSHQIQATQKDYLPDHGGLRDIGVPQDTHHVPDQVRHGARGLDVAWMR